MCTNSFIHLPRLLNLIAEKDTGGHTIKFTDELG
jgi:hypothetical protein